MGVLDARVFVTDTMKWDTAEIADDVPGAEKLAEEMGIDRGKPLVVAGSTAPEEHAMLRDAVSKGVQLLCAPRKPEWFDDAAADLEGCARRSKGDRGSATGRFLLDTIGELRKAYALADVVVIGRSFGNLHGSDMMEPIALGKATIVGPRVEDFLETAKQLLAGDGLIQTDAARLPETIKELLNDPQRRAELAHNGRDVIRTHQGATNRQVEYIITLLDRR
jgi:3-deoxy-D-manno-octulosonic-acid transferase